VSFHQRPGLRAGGSWNGIVILSKTGLQRLLDKREKLFKQEQS
jgi:hypothetical protein